MSTNRKNLLRNTVAVNVGCSCRRPNFSDVFQPKPKTKTKTSSYQNPDLSLSSSSSWDRVVGQSATSTTFSPKVDPSPQFSEPEYEYDPNSFKTVCGYGRIGESIAVVKHSDDPYLDFRHSMLQMILEKEIYSRDDLRQLLDCFLQLNSPYHHEIIVQAFTEIWNGVFSVTVKRV